jgi:hypothetical protein
VPYSIIICHDERYPELVRLPVLAGSRVVFYLSHESPLKEESKLGPYRAQVQARAMENTVWVVHANAPANADATGSYGQSRLIAPDGNLLQEATIFREEVLTATLDLSRATAGNPRRSLTGAPLARWWQEGVRQVRMIDGQLDVTPRRQSHDERLDGGAGAAPGNGPGFRIRKLRCEALPGLWILALLYEPEKLQGKVPVALAVNGHDRRNGKAVLGRDFDPLH